jgi:hypothetical protein
LIKFHDENKGLEIEIKFPINTKNDDDSINNVCRCDTHL